MRSAISAYRKPEMKNVSPHFVDEDLNEDLNSVPTSGIPEEFRKLSRFVIQNFRTANLLVHTCFAAD